jgi:hypothetical protein
MSGPKAARIDAVSHCVPVSRITDRDILSPYLPINMPDISKPFNLTYPYFISNRSASYCT